MKPIRSFKEQEDWAQEARKRRLAALQDRTRPKTGSTPSWLLYAGYVAFWLVLALLSHGCINPTSPTGCVQQSNAAGNSVQTSARVGTGLPACPQGAH